MKKMILPAVSVLVLFLANPTVNAQSQAMGGSNPAPQAMGGSNPVPQAMGGSNPVPQAMGGSNPVPQGMFGTAISAVLIMFGF